MKIEVKGLAIAIIILTATSTYVFAFPNVVQSQSTSEGNWVWDGGMIARPPHVVLGAGWTPAYIHNAASPLGGAPFCNSLSLPTESYILCYPPNFIRTAYNFPPLQYSARLGTYSDGFNGTGSTIVIVDAFGSPTIAYDLAQYDGNFSVPPPPSFTILCGENNWQDSTGCTNGAINGYNATSGGGCNGCFDELGWSEEITLDVTQSHALAPGAKIVLVVANSDLPSDLGAAENAVVNNPTYAGSIMTQSFGLPDSVVDPSTKAGYDNTYRTAALNGWTVLAKSGDDGANEGYGVLSGTTRTELMPAWPATSPMVLAVGGTQGLPYGGQYGGLLQRNSFFNSQPVSCAAAATCNTGLVVIYGGGSGCANAARPAEPTGCTPTGYGGEGAWQEVGYIGPTSSSGGGVSTLYARPNFQSSQTSTYATIPSGTVTATGRTTPDVAFNAAVNGGALAYMDDFGENFATCNPVCTGTPSWLVLGGTSAASDAWAAVIAILNQEHGGPVGYINPAIYSLAMSSAYGTAFHDIRAGNNTDCPAHVNSFTPSPFPTTPPYYDCGVNYPSSSIDCSQYGYCGVVDPVTPLGFAAGPGYDLTTGWGTPNVSNFISSFLSLYATNNGNINLPGPGWDLFSVPEVPVNTAIGQVLANLIADNSFSVIYSYQGGKWYGAMLVTKYPVSTLSPIGSLSLLKTVQDGFAYWILMTKPDQITYSIPSTGYILAPPPASPPSYPLAVGWNLVGFKPQPTIGPENTGAYLTSVTYNTAHVYVYVNSSGSWQLNGAGTPIEVGQGLWVDVTSPSTLTP